MTLYDTRGNVVARSTGRAIHAERDADREAKVREQLKSIDSLLDVRYIEWAGRYSLVCQWPSNDERWKMYQSGEIGEPFDSLGWFCQDMQDPTSVPVDIDSIEQLVLERLASCDNTRHHWRDRMKQIIDKNAKVRKSKQQEVIDRAQDIAETLWHAVGRHDDHKVEGIIAEIAEGKV
jgi:hypothetical protein